MAWTATGDGRLFCDEHNKEFARGRSCPTCPAAGTVVVPPKLPGEYERLCEQAKAEGLPDRLGLERELQARLRKADREGDFYGKRGKKVIAEGVFKQQLDDGERRLIDVSADAEAVKWYALREAARNRGDKIARAYHGLVSQREHYARLERQERLAESLEQPGRKPRGQA